MVKAPFDYRAPDSLQEAVGILGRHSERAKVMAGGTDLVVALQKEKMACEIMVDIGRIGELKEIKLDGDFLVVGAAVNFTTLTHHPLVREAAPLLGQAASEVGSPQIRNRGTIGGNLGTASPAGDLLTPLAALEAEIVVTGPGGRRQAAVENFLRGGERERLQPDEIICQVRVPRAGSGETRSAFVKLGRRKALAISRLNLALYLEMRGEGFARVRLAVGAAGPAPFRVIGAEQALEQKGCSIQATEIMDQVSRAVAASLGDRPSAPYKTLAVKGLVWQALAGCGLV